jgi:cell division protein FtsQ
VGYNRKKVNKRDAARAAVVNAAWRVKRSWMWMAAAVVLGVAGYGAWWAYWFLHTTPYFRVDRVNVTGCRHASPQEIAALSGVVLRTSIFDVDIGTVADKVYLHPWVKTVKVSKKYPRELRIAVTEHQPAILAALGGIYLADSEGDVFKKIVRTDDTSLPIVTGIAKEDYAGKREQARSRIRDAIALVQEIQKSGVGGEVSEVHFDPVAGYTVYFDKGLEVSFGRGKFKERTSVLAGVLAEAAGRGMKPAAVHLDNEFRGDWVPVRVR